MHINTDLRVYLIPVTVAIDKQTNASSEDGKEEPLFTTGRSESWCNHYGNQCGNFSEVIFDCKPKDVRSSQRDTWNPCL